MLQLISKTPVKFRWEDDLAETVVVIQPDDDSEVIMAKLQRVLELEGGAPSALTFPSGVRAPLAPGVPVFTPADRAATEERLEGVKVNGWNEDAVDGGLENLPEIG